MSCIPITSQDVIQNAQLIVIKIGSALVKGEHLDKTNQVWMDAFAQDVHKLKSQGKKIVIVSSGGVALGRKALGISSNIAPSSIPLSKKQAASAVGQYHLFNGYFNAFNSVGITAAQVLLTMSETENRRMSLNARETIHTLLEHNIIPIINENDTVSTGEIRFGDNDRLSVRVAQMIMADVVILLSTIDGLYTGNPDKIDDAQHVPLIESIDENHIEMAGDAIAGLSTGGMKSKIEAAISATKSGIPLIISHGKGEHTLSYLCEVDTKKSSLFVAKKSGANARKTWLGSHMQPKGYVVIDDGALTALNNGKSLLPVGVKSVSGDFRRGDVIEIKSPDGIKIAMGICAYNKEDTSKIIGKTNIEIANILDFVGRDELIHRNDMVLES